MRLDKLAEELGDKIDVEWKTFLLRPEAPKTTDHDKFVEYTKSWLNPAEQEPDTTFTVWASDEAQPQSSVPAQVAHKAVSALAPDRADDYHHRLLTAYFTENRNIGDAETLLDLAAEIGIDRDALETVARENQESFTKMVIDEHNRAIQSNVTAVPTVVFENSFALPGAQPVETYERLVERIAEKKAELATEP